MEKLTREQINKRLDRLRASNMDDESYFTTRPGFAMCYSMAPMKTVRDKRDCAGCGKSFEIAWSNHATENIHNSERIIGKFRQMGFEGKLVCNCDECVAADNLRPFEIWLRASGEDEWHISVPEIAVSHNAVASHEYNLVLDFLKAHTGNANIAKIFHKLYNGQFAATHSWICKIKRIDFSKTQTVEDGLSLVESTLKKSNKEKADYLYKSFVTMFREKYKTLSYRGIIGVDLVMYSREAGFIKTQIDLALAKVLGLEIIYQRDEVERNIRHIFSENERSEHIDEALEILNNYPIKSFSVFQYIEFMAKLNARFKSESDGE